eukprot:scaffold123396_cov30-Tisochrysis_lutea.AAC.6
MPFNSQSGHAATSICSSSKNCCECAVSASLGGSSANISRTMMLRTLADTVSIRHLRRRGWVHARQGVEGCASLRSHVGHRALQQQRLEPAAKAVIVAEQRTRLNGGRVVHTKRRGCRMRRRACACHEQAQRLVHDLHVKPLLKNDHALHSWQTAGR